MGTTNMTTERKPRPHAGVIKAWADGYEVQYRVLDGEEWCDTRYPEFSVHNEYRVKPESKKPPTTWYQGVFSNPGGWFFIPDRLFRGEDDARSYFKNRSGVEEYSLIRLIPIYTEEE